MTWIREHYEMSEPDRVRFLVLDLWHPNSRTWTRVTVGEADPRWDGKCLVGFTETGKENHPLVWIEEAMANAVVKMYRSDDRVLRREAVVWVDGPCTHRVQWIEQGSLPCCRAMTDAAAQQVRPDPTLVGTW